MCHIGQDTGRTDKNDVAKQGARPSRIVSGPVHTMHYVYLLRSLTDIRQTYVGYSTDLKTRLRTHNAGGSPHTSRFRPWRLETYLAFSDKHQALAFEGYLKSHSGKAFAAKRLWVSKPSPQARAF